MFSERMVMTDPARDGNPVSKDSVRNTVYKKDFWSKENLQYGRPHYRLEKSARIVNRIAQGGRQRTLLDVGCGGAVLRLLIRRNIEYYGIDIAIHDPAPNLIESDFLEAPIPFPDKRFDIVVAQGVFEYVGDFQPWVFSEIARLLNDSGVFIGSYVNFDHHDRFIYWPYSNVQGLDEFKRSLAQHFQIRRFFPTSHNWRHTEPSRKFARAANMHINVNVPFISRALAVEYFFVCSPRLTQ
jgi:SAM-dependent methyltransferase